VTFFATVLFELPFINTTLYVGPFATAMGGADIAWIVGGIFCSGLYYILNRDLAKETSLRLENL